MKKIISLAAISVAILITGLSVSCKKTTTENNTEATTTTGKVGVYIEPSTNFFHVDVTTVAFYIDGARALNYNINGATTKDCYGHTVDFQLTLEKGAHKFALVTADNHYIDGNLTIAAGQCTYIPVGEDQFSGSKTNYGTTKGALTFVRTSLPFGRTSLYVDDVSIGTLTGLPFHQLCGVDNGATNIVANLSPGSHTYKAVDSENKLQWTGRATISANSCSVIKF